MENNEIKETKKPSEEVQCLQILIKKMTELQQTNEELRAKVKGIHSSMVFFTVLAVLGIIGSFVWLAVYLGA